MVASCRVLRIEPRSWRAVGEPSLQSPPPPIFKSHSDYSLGHEEALWFWPGKNLVLGVLPQSLSRAKVCLLHFKSMSDFWLSHVFLDHSLLPGFLSKSVYESFGEFKS